MKKIEIENEERIVTPGPGKEKATENERRDKREEEKEPGEEHAEVDLEVDGLEELPGDDTRKRPGVKEDEEEEEESDEQITGKRDHQKKTDNES